MGTTIDDAAILASLRTAALDEICQATGASPQELAGARDAFLRARAPVAGARVSAPVSGTVEILRDRAGVPHVYAPSTAGVYFGLGFAMAQDRLWQMDRLRRRALGRQAEILGPTYVQIDLQHR